LSFFVKRGIIRPNYFCTSKYEYRRGFIMGKGTFIALVALLVALAGTVVAFAAYFKRRSSVIYDDFEEDADEDEDMDDELDYYATQVDGDDIPEEEEAEEDEQPAEESEAEEPVPEEAEQSKPGAPAEQE